MPHRDQARYQQGYRTDQCVSLRGVGSFSFSDSSSASASSVLIHLVAVVDCCQLWRFLLSVIPYANEAKQSG